VYRLHRRMWRMGGGVWLILIGLAMVWLPFGAWGWIVGKDGVDAAFWLVVFSLVLGPIGLLGVCVALVGLGTVLKAVVG
jgi:hypothetical protein